MPIDQMILDYRGFSRSGGWVYGMPYPVEGQLTRIARVGASRGKLCVVAPGSIGLCTAMSDKLGRRIYQGDILQGDDLSYLGVVVYDARTASFAVRHEGEDSLTPLAEVAIRASIMGNAYELSLLPGLRRAK